MKGFDYVNSSNKYKYRFFDWWAVIRLLRFLLIRLYLLLQHFHTFKIGAFYR